MSETNSLAACLNGCAVIDAVGEWVDRLWVGSMTFECINSLAACSNGCAWAELWGELGTKGAKCCWGPISKHTFEVACLSSPGQSWMFDWSLSVLRHTRWVVGKGATTSWLGGPSGNIAIIASPHGHRHRTRAMAASQRHEREHGSQGCTL